MPARLVQVTIFNNSEYPIVWQDDGRPHGFWQEPWYPSNIKNLKKGEQASFRLESGGIATGVEGWALFKVDVPFASNVPVRTEFFRLNFSRAYIETEPFKGDDPSHIEYWRQDPRTGDAPHDGPVLASVSSLGCSDIANIASSPFEFIAALPGAPLTAPIFLLNETIAKHVAWIVEVRNVDSTFALPLQLAPTEILYAVTPRVEGTTGSTTVPATASDDHRGAKLVPASGGDLMWFRYGGRQDGSFDWEGPDKVGNRWDGFTRVFSDGEGIVYAVTPRSEATFSSAELDATPSGGHLGGAVTPASGGDLMWYRHDGRDDGTFRWEGPRKVGMRWDVFTHVFSGGDGIIYAIQENGDLMWYRHVGRSDGSFIWEGPKKVGTGWGDLTHVFSGGDGIMYAVTPRVGAGSHITGGSTPASGGDLMWYRHVGREDGSFAWEGPKVVGTRWDTLEHVFSGGDGILYGVTHAVGASFHATEVSVSSPGDHIPAKFTPASGGDLMWYHHVGREDGSFRWEGPRRVGTGWGALTHVFSGGVSRI